MKGKKRPRRWPENCTEQGWRSAQSRDFKVEETLSKCTLKKVDKVITKIAPNTPVF